MSETMVERVRRAISPHGMTMEERARAAIEAMREPTDAMLLAMARFWHDNYRPEHVREDTALLEEWQDAIDAALQEKPE